MRFLLKITLDDITQIPSGVRAQAVDKDGNLLLAMSTAAFNAYTELQKEKIEKNFKKIIHSDISTIEKYGGGSARCMLAELF